MSTDRVAYVVLHVDGDVARAMSAVVKEHEMVGMGQLRRPTLTNQPSNLATLATGARPLRHGAFTRLVPAEGDSKSSNKAMVEAGLRFRTSRDFGAPTIWNRLASRGVSSAVVGWPYAETKDDDLIREVSLGSLMALAKKEGISVPEATLGVIRGAVETRPEIGCICVHAWFRRGSSEEDVVEEDAEEESTQALTIDDDSEFEEGDEAEDEKAVDAATREKVDEILGWLDAVGRQSSAKHLLAVLVAPRIGRYVLFGPHGTAIDGQLLGAPLAAPIVLALLGQSPASDLVKQSIIKGEAEADGSGASGWSIEGGVLSPPDFDPSIQRVIDGEGGPLLRRNIVQYLTQRNWIGISDGDPAVAVEAGRRLLEIDDSAATRFSLVLAIAASGDATEAVKEIERLGEAHPDSVLVDLVNTLPALQRSDEEIAEVLDRIPLEKVPTALGKGVWARAAARIGRDADAMTGLWRLIMSGYALNSDRITFARLAVKRNEGVDASRAALATRGMTGLVSNKDGRPRTGVALLRAKALTLAGRRPAAIRVLEQFTRHHPLEEQAVKMLEAIRRDADQPSEGD